MEKTFAILKPGVLQRGIAGNIISMLEEAGFKITALKMMQIDRQTAELHYGEHKGRDFFDPLIDYICSAPVILLCLERTNAAAALRRLCGATAPDEAASGTVRGRFGVSKRMNIIHASDSPESAMREIDLFFGKNEIFNWSSGNEKWF
jgi:nucleoside-diphosphate kinase